MQKQLIRADTIVTMDPARRVIQDGGIVVNGDTIEQVLTADQHRGLKEFSGELHAASGLTAIPGFVQTHIHLCQTLFRGLADDLELLDWLKIRIFPFEAAHSPESIYASARVGLAELIRSGTTTIMDMGSIHHEDAVVRAIQESGIRAFVGKAMMDLNDIEPRFKESTQSSLESTLRQAEQWHRSANGRIRYAVAPRFVLSCTEALLKEAHAMTGAFPGMLFHTHAAENRHELEAVRRRCSMDNVEYFESLGILQSNTCLAHCIWLNPAELDLLERRRAKVLHCPSSNLKLGSGIARIPEMISRKITVALGADGAPCNNTLDMFQEMRLAALLQKPLHGPTAMSAETVFEIATLGGATALGIEREIGSIEPGKRADIVLLDLARIWNSTDPSVPAGTYSSLVYSGSPENVRAVMVDGVWLYRDGVYKTLDEQEAMVDARRELRKLLGRM